MLFFFACGSDGGAKDPAIDASPGADAAPDVDAPVVVDPMVNGCTEAAAMDMTGMAQVSLPAWTFGHTACVKVSANTTVTWAGNFGTHPLEGGTSEQGVATPDAASPIAGNSPAGGEVQVLFTASGSFPYYCVIHLGMRGVVYVE